MYLIHLNYGSISVNEQIYCSCPSIQSSCLHRERVKQSKWRGHICSSHLFLPFHSIKFTVGQGKEGIIDFISGSELLIAKAKNGHLTVVSTGRGGWGTVVHLQGIQTQLLALTRLQQRDTAPGLCCAALLSQPVPELEPHIIHLSLQPPDRQAQTHQVIVLSVTYLFPPQGSGFNSIPCCISNCRI